jgi:mRNA-degrading endonuclease RelE of RelBE toxin-antitoxin system
MGHNTLMYLTVAQTPLFQRHARDIWTSEELDDLVEWIAVHATDGDVIAQSGGLRKIRWSASGRGKRGGARVIYYNMLDDGTVWLLMAYTKAKFDDLPTSFLKELKNAIPQKNSRR